MSVHGDDMQVNGTEGVDQAPQPRDGPREDLVERERERDLFPFPFPFSCYRSITVLCPFLCPFPGTDYLCLKGHFYIKNLLFQFENLCNDKYMCESRYIKIR